MTHLLTISGALRAGSYNRKLAAQAATLFDPETLTIADLTLPLYNGDTEDQSGLPASVTTLVDQIAAADAVLIASPEYNKAITGVLKNALDWISRDKRDAFKNKPTALMSANAGRTGGETGQYMLRACLVPLRAKVLPGPGIMIANAANEFETGALQNPRYLTPLQELMDALKAETKAA